MEQRVELAPDCYAVIRLQPFNSAAFGFVSAQIAEIVAADRPNALLAEIERAARSMQVRHIVSRVPAEDGQLKAALQHAGFYYAETSISLSLGALNQRDYGALAGRIELAPARESELTELSRIASDDFHHGRFLEDPFLDNQLARRRHALWVHELAKENKLYAASAGGKLVGFHAEQVLDGLKADLILTGAARRYSVLAPAIWSAALQSLQARGIQHCSTMVSAANLGVLNLYQRLGFRYDAAWVGFHRFFD